MVVPEFETGYSSAVLIGGAPVLAVAFVVFRFPPFKAAMPCLNSLAPFAATVVLRSPDADWGTVPSRPAMRSPALSAKELMFPLVKLKLDEKRCLTSSAFQNSVVVDWKGSPNCFTNAVDCLEDSAESNEQHNGE